MFWMRRGKHADDLHHAGVHVVEEVTVECPVADMFSSDIDTHLFGRLDRHSMFTRHVRFAAIHEIEKHSMQVDGVASSCH